MRFTLRAAAVAAAAIGLVFAQGGALKESAVKMGPRAITLKYAPPASAAEIPKVRAALHTEADLDIQGLAVPKGDYTLRLIPEGQEWQLVIVKQAAPAKELGRVPLDMKKAAAPGGPLTITVAAQGRVAGKIEFASGSTIATAPFSVEAVKANLEW